MTKLTGNTNTITNVESIGSHHFIMSVDSGIIQTNVVLTRPDIGDKLLQIQKDDGSYGYVIEVITD